MKNHENMPLRNIARCLKLFCACCVKTRIKGIPGDCVPHTNVPDIKNRFVFWPKNVNLTTLFYTISTYVYISVVQLYIMCNLARNAIFYVDAAYNKYIFPV